MKGSILTKRTAALGAVVALLLAAFAGFGQQQVAKADLIPPFSISVADVSPPPGGEIFYEITVSDTTGQPPKNFVVEALNTTNFDAANPKANPPHIVPTGSTITVNDIAGTFRWDVTDNSNALSAQTFWVGLKVDPAAAVGATLAPQFKICEDSNDDGACGGAEPSVLLTPPARTVGRPSVTKSVMDAQPGDTVFFYFTLPKGWSCNGDANPLSARDCDADNDGLIEPGDGLTLSSNLSNVSTTLSTTNLAQVAVITVSGKVATGGTVEAELNTRYFGDEGLGGSPSADDSLAPYAVKDSIGVWLWITATSPGGDDGLGVFYTGSGVSGGQQVYFSVANAHVIGATSVTASLTFPSEFQNLQVVAQPTGWNCAVTGNTVTCTNSSGLAPGATADLLKGGANGDLKVVLTANPGNTSRSLTLQASATFTFPGPFTVTKSTQKTISQRVHFVTADLHANPSPNLPNSGTQVVEYDLRILDSHSAPLPRLGNLVATFTPPPGALAVLYVDTTTGMGLISGTTCSVDPSTLVVTCTAAGPVSVDSTTSNYRFAKVYVQLPANTNPGPITRAATLQVTFDTFRDDPLQVGSQDVATGTGLSESDTATVWHPGTGIGTVTYNLVFGWNLITWGGQNNVAIASPNGLGSIVSSISSVYTFDALTQQWKFWFPTGGPVNTLTTLTSGTAYFIYVTAPGGASLTVPAGP